ncbi:MAG: DUF4446 family protein [Lachnospiraceae bacterium]|nr:DUF4446 family protein [Lachnospiraceae bacterium]
MNSNFLNMIGLGGIDAGFLILGLFVINIILLILIIVAFVNISSFKKKYKKFMLGKDGASLEKDIMTLYEDNKFIKLNVSENRDDIKKLFKKQESSLQKIGLVKYDAFKEMGGKLSFALVLLDENNNGFLLNSVHSSDGCYSYTKRVKDGDSEIALSNEEKVAVERAVNGNPATEG